MTPPNNENLKFASIFSGCGGFDDGFIQAGFKCIGAFDIDPLTIEVHKKNLKSPAEACDLSEGTLPIELPQNLDVLLSGSPCQGFSVAGRRDVDDPRNELLLDAGRIALSVNPKVFIAENVAGVRSGAHRKYWDGLTSMLKGNGYKTADLICEGTNMGVPQLRRRAVLLAWRTDKDVEISIPRTDGGTVGRVLTHLRGIPNHSVKVPPPDSSLSLIAKKIKCGQKLSNVRGGDRAVHTWDIPEVFGSTTKEERVLLEKIMRLRRQFRVRDNGEADPVRIDLLVSILGTSVHRLLNSLERKGYVRQFDNLCDLRHTYNGKFRRLQLNQPSPTVDTRFGDPRYFLHPKYDRGFTVREAARIQGFSDSFIFEGPERAQYRMVGNAVPPPMAKCLAIFVKKALI